MLRRKKVVAAMMPNAGEDILRTTGGQIDCIVLALLESAHDPQESVSHAVCNSLHCLGQHQPNLVLSSCLSYLQRHPKLVLDHRVLLLNVMEHVCKNSSDGLSKSLVEHVVKLAVDEIVASKESNPEWSTAASTILVSLGHHGHIHRVMETLLTHFSPGGALPHYYIVHTLAQLATANVFGMVPFIKAILGTMLPMLHHAKQENMKFVFAYALACFSEAIHDYLANIEKAPDPSVTKEAFSTEIGSAFKILFSGWLHSRPKVRAMVVEALGHMALLLQPNILEEELPPVLQDVVGLYRRHHDSHVMTKGLGLILTATIKLEISALDQQVDAVLTAIFPQVCIIPDYSQPAAVKNHNEVLRCFTILAPSYMDRIINFLLFKLDNSSENVRIGALTVLKHLINSSGIGVLSNHSAVLPESHLSGKIGAITAGLKGVLPDPNNKVKKIIAQVIVALAHHGYLDSEGGGKAMIFFLVKQCALPPDDPANKRPREPDYVSNDALRSMCENVLHLLTSTVESLGKVLWPDMLECLMEEEYTRALGTVCRNLVGLLERLREQGDFEISYPTPSNSKLPSGPALFARLAVLLAAQPSGSLAHFLRLSGPLVHRTLTALWDRTLPRLAAKLPGSPTSSHTGSSPGGGYWDQADWESQVEALVVDSLAELDSEDWTLKFSSALLHQIDLYRDLPLGKLFHFKLLGLTLKRISNKTLVGQALDAMFDRVHYADPKERQGLAEAVGHAGAAHLDLVVVRLEKVVRDETRRHSGLFSLLKGGDVDLDRVRAAVVLCLGHVAVQAPPQLLISRAETPILRAICSYYHQSKDPCVKKAMLVAVRLLSQALVRLSEPHDLQSRSELLSQIVAILEPSETALKTGVLSLALAAAASLVQLDISGQEDCTTLLETAVAAVFQLPRSEPAEIQATVDSLHQLLYRLLLRNRSPLTLTYLLKILHHWFTSSKELERTRSMNSVVFLLSTYLEELKPQSFSIFTPLGQLLGLVVPRCTDPYILVRVPAMEAVQLLLHIDSRSQDRPYEEPPALTKLKDSLGQEDSAALFTFTTEIAQILANYLQFEHLMPFIKYLIVALKDPVASCSSGSVVVLNQFFKLRGSELRQEIGQIWEEMQVQLREVGCNKTRLGLYHCVRTLATLHLGPTMGALLSAPLPLNIAHQECWHLLAKEPDLGANILNFLLDQLVDHPLCETGPRGTPTATQHPFLSLAALTEMFRVAETEHFSQNNFEKIFSILLMTLGAYIAVAPPQTPPGSPEKRSPKLHPPRCVVEAMKSFLLCAQEERLVYHLAEAGYWIAMEEEASFHLAISALAQVVCQYCPKRVARLFGSLRPQSCRVGSQKVAVVAFLSELLTAEFPGKSELVEPLVSSLQGQLDSPCRLVRRLAIHGLGHVSGLSKFQKYSTTVISAMMSGLDDRDDPDHDISLEAMAGLSNILEQLDHPGPDLDTVKVAVCLHVCCFFDKEKPEVREAAFRLLGRLAKLEAESSTRNEESASSFAEEVHKALVMVLVHLNDENQAVSEVCKTSLMQLSSHLPHEEVAAILRKFLQEDAHFHYEEFLNSFSKLLVLMFLDKVPYYLPTAINYLSSHRPQLQCNAVLLLGYLLGNIPPENHSIVEKEKVCGAIVSLLKDPTPAVRLRAAEALSYLYSY